MPIIVDVREAETLAYPNGYVGAEDETANVGDSDYAANAEITNITTDDGIVATVVHGTWSQDADWRDQKFTAKRKTRAATATEAQALHALALAALDPPDEWEGQELATI